MRVTVSRHPSGVFAARSIRSWLWQRRQVAWKTSGGSTSGPIALVLAADAKTALALLDQNHDDRLSARELEHFPGTLKRFDKNGDGELDLKELESAVTAARAELPFAGFDDFLTRYDLDLDNAVSRLEFPGGDALFARLDVDGDGAITAKDAAGPVKRPDFGIDAMRWR